MELLPELESEASTLSDYTSIGIVMSEADALYCEEIQNSSDSSTLPKTFNPSASTIPLDEVESKGYVISYPLLQQQGMVSHDIYDSKIKEYV